VPTTAASAGAPISARTSAAPGGGARRIATPLGTSASRRCGTPAARITSITP
jgi:hypothetical protein